MSKAPGISVIIPTLNRPELLIRCVESINNQTFKGEINCIVVDSSDNDKTELAVKNFDITNKNFSLKYLRNEDSVFPIDNWVYAINSVNTEFAKFICDDDWLESSFFSDCIEIFEKNHVDCVVSNISLHKEFTKGKEVINGYYKYEEGVASKSQVVNSFIGVSDILPVTPTATLMKTLKFKDSFYSSLKHFECTKYLFGFDFYMNYFSVFSGKGTYLLQKNLVNSWAGKDSMTLNTKMAKISYCYFFALLRLIEQSNYKISPNQKKYIQHRLATIKIKAIINKEYKEIILPTQIKPKLVISKLALDKIKRIYIKLLYKYIKK